MKMKSTILAGAAVLAMMLGGCDKKVGGQVVAIVDGQEVTQQELNAELNGQAIPPSADKKAIMNQVLQRVIDRKLLVEQAKKQGLDQSPNYLALVSRAQDAILIDLLSSKIAKAQPIPTASAADQFVSENATMFGERKRYQLDQIAFAQTNDPALTKKLAAALTMDAVEDALKTSGVPYQKGQGAMDTGGLQPAIAKQIAALPAGEPFLIPQNGQIVASVIRSTEVLPVPPQQSTPVAAELIRRKAVETALIQQVKTARGSAKIEYQPGFAPPKATPTAPKS